METNIQITCFENVSQTIQPRWKINNEQCVLEDEELVMCSKSVLTELEW